MLYMVPVIDMYAGSHDRYGDDVCCICVPVFVCMFVFVSWVPPGCLLHVQSLGSSVEARASQLALDRLPLGGVSQPA